MRVMNVNNMVSFGVFQGEAYILSFDEGTELKAVPGSVQPSDTMEEGKYMKVIAFKLGQVSQSRTAMLEAMRVQPLVAIYVDEQGHTKVSGSMDFPLVFSYTITGGLYECQLEGSDIMPNPYLASYLER